MNWDLWFIFRIRVRRDDRAMQAAVRSSSALRESSSSVPLGAPSHCGVLYSISLCSCHRQVAVLIALLPPLSKTETPIYACEGGSCRHALLLSSHPDILLTETGSAT